MNTKEYYKKSYYGIKSACISTVDISLLTPHIKTIALDVGCGQGLLVKKLVEKGYRVEGCDLFDGVTKFGENFFVHNMEKEPTQKKYDFIYTTHVLEHIFDYISFLRNVWESLNEDGLFFVAVPNAYSLLSRLRFLFGDERITMGNGELCCVENNKLEPHIRFLGFKTLKLILEENGFKVKEFYGTHNGKKHWLNRFAGQLNFLCEKTGN